MSVIYIFEKSDNILFRGDIKHISIHYLVGRLIAIYKSDGL